jgi:hypothetical protein
MTTNSQAVRDRRSIGTRSCHLPSARKGSVRPLASRILDLRINGAITLSGRALAYCLDRCQRGSCAYVTRNASSHRGGFTHLEPVAGGTVHPVCCCVQWGIRREDAMQRRNFLFGLFAGAAALGIVSNSTLVEAAESTADLPAEGAQEAQRDVRPSEGRPPSARGRSRRVTPQSGVRGRAPRRRAVRRAPVRRRRVVTRRARPGVRRGTVLRMRY